MRGQPPSRRASRPFTHLPGCAAAAQGAGVALPSRPGQSQQRRHVGADASSKTTPNSRCGGWRRIRRRSLFRGRGAFGRMLRWHACNLPTAVLSTRPLPLPGVGSLPAGGWHGPHFGRPPPPAPVLRRGGGAGAAAGAAARGDHTKDQAVCQRQHVTGGVLPGQASSKVGDHNIDLVAVSFIFHHRRRINTKEKAKVVAAVWGMELIPCCTSYFTPEWYEEKDE